MVDTLNPTGYAQVLEELVEDLLFPSSLTVTKAYTYGHDLVACEQLTDGLWQTHYYGYDGHGSTRQLFDANGHLTDTYTYDAFGTLLSRTGTTDNHYLYCGEQWDDDLGLYYLRARYMNPWAGRFWSMDSFEGRIYEPITLNKYTYANSNPIKYVDYSGYYSNAAEVSIATTITAKTSLSANLIGNAYILMLVGQAISLAPQEFSSEENQIEVLEKEKRRPDRAIMRLQLQRNSAHKKGSGHYWSTILSNSKIKGVTVRQVQNQLHQMWFNAFKFGFEQKHDHDLYNAIIEFSDRLNRFPTNGMPQGTTERINFPDPDRVFRIDLESIKERNLRSFN